MHAFLGHLGTKAIQDGGLNGQHENILRIEMTLAHFSGQLILNAGSQGGSR